jgi:DMSO/TMAO reductase YedYZ molybdopterin-dependent catalytic subunit
MTCSKCLGSNLPPSISARAIHAGCSCPASRARNGRTGRWAMRKWTGILVKDVLDRAGVRPGAVQVRFNGLDEPVVPDAPDFKKSLDIDHARDAEVMIAFAMNGE